MEREIVLILLIIIELALIWFFIKYGKDLERNFTFKKRL